MIFSKNSKFSSAEESIGNSLSDKERGFYVDQDKDTSGIG